MSVLSINYYIIYITNLLASILVVQDTGKPKSVWSEFRLYFHVAR